MSATDERVSRLGRRNTSIQTEVSTRTTRPPAGRAVVAHRGEIPVPEPGPGKLEDAIRPHPPDELLERATDRRRVRALTAELDRLLEEMLIEHKICAFHAHTLHSRPQPVKPRERRVVRKERT
jgi:hypothetical protein